jgi:hypothetical protein
MDWLLILPQLPATSPDLRQVVWRRMHAAGALELQSGAWLLPYSPGIERFAEDLLARILESGASGYIFETIALTPAIENDLLEKFRSSRDEEYAEFIERCDALLAELKRETALGRFTYAELEEAEEDLRKLEKWLEKIQARDFARAKLNEAAGQQLRRCQAAYTGFARRVYATQGVSDPVGAVQAA